MNQAYSAGAGHDLPGLLLPTGVSRFSIPTSVRKFKPSPSPSLLVRTPSRSAKIAVRTDGRNAYNNNNNNDDEGNKRKDNGRSADYINNSGFMDVQGGVMSFECSEQSWSPPPATAARTCGIPNGSAMCHETASSPLSSSSSLAEAAAQARQEQPRTRHRSLLLEGSGNGLLGAGGNGLFPGGDLRTAGELNDTSSTVTPTSDSEDKEEEKREVNAGVLRPPQEGSEGVMGENERSRGILVVDDTATVRNLLKRACTNMGYAVDTACTGEVGGWGTCVSEASSGKQLNALLCSSVLDAVVLMPTVMK